MSRVLQAARRVVSQLVDAEDATVLRLALGRLLAAFDARFAAAAATGTEGTKRAPSTPRMHLWSGHDTTIFPVSARGSRLTLRCLPPLRMHLHDAPVIGRVDAAPSRLAGTTGTANGCA